MSSSTKGECWLMKMKKMEKCNIVSGKDIWRNKNKKMQGIKKKPENNVRSGIWTHALSRGPELESGALDHSAILTLVSYFVQKYYIDNYYYVVSQNLRHAIILKMIKIYFRNNKSSKSNIFNILILNFKSKRCIYFIMFHPF